MPAIPTPLPLGQIVTRIESLGNNTVMIKDGKMVVQGPTPNNVEANAINRKLQSGEAKLGTVNGKKVLYYTDEKYRYPQKRSIQQEKGGPSNNNNASSNTPSFQQKGCVLNKRSN